MIAKDIMTREVISVRPKDKLEDVAKLLVVNKISGVPVVDDECHLLGIISEQDLLIKADELKMPFYITLFDSIIFIENPIRFNNNLKKYTAVNVNEVMTEKVIAVEEDATIPEIIAKMHAHKINRVPVVRHNKLVGIISRNDILKSLVQDNG